MTLCIENSLHLPHFNDNEHLSKIIRGSIRRKGRTGQLDESLNTALPWSARLFFLDQSKLYQSLNSEDQFKILKSCNDFILSESYFIEKAGLAYCAKMILLGESTEVRQMYGLIASDESVHLQWLSPYVDESLRTVPQGKFIYFISQLIEQCNANTLYFLVQTVLEGWGISYYKTLSSACQMPELQKTLLNIVKDEAIHHKTGVALFNANKLSLQDEKLLQDGMKSYADVLKLSAQNIVKCVENVVGELSLNELNQLFSDLQTELTAKFKLGILRQLMAQPATQKYILQLEDNNYFTPYSAKHCAEVYYQQRN